MRGKFFIVAPIIGLKSIIDLFGPLGLYSWQRAFINVICDKYSYSGINPSCPREVMAICGQWAPPWVDRVYDRKSVPGFFAV